MNEHSTLRKVYSLLVLLIIVVMMLCVKLWDLSIPYWLFSMIIGLLIVGSGIVGIKTKSLLLKRAIGKSYYGDRKGGYYLNWIIIILGILIIIVGIYVDLIRI